MKTSPTRGLPPSGGLGGCLIPGFRGSLPVRALRGGVCDGDLAGFRLVTSLGSGPFLAGTPVKIGPFRPETPFRIGPFWSETPDKDDPFAMSSSLPSDASMFVDGRSSSRTGGEERARGRRCCSPATRCDRWLGAARRRIDDSPTIHTPALAPIIDELYLTGRKAAQCVRAGRCCSPGQRLGTSPRSIDRPPRQSRR